jgi:hypothetical protein
MHNNTSLIFLPCSFSTCSCTGNFSAISTRR